MADEFTNYKVDPNRKFIGAIRRAKLEAADLRIPLNLISKDWFKTNKAIFNLNGPGKYKDLTKEYKVQKKRRFGFVYPILKAKGVLEASVTQSTDTKAISDIVNKAQLTLGTRVGYAQAVQKIRPFVFFGPESVEWRTDKTFAMRPTVWLNIINDYILQRMGAAGVGQVVK